MLLRDALRQFKIGKKTWRDLVEERLMNPAQKMTGTQLYEITPQQAARLAQFTSVRKSIKDERVTMSAVAFEMARRGIRDAQIERLVKKELGKRVKRYIGTLRRSGQRLFGFAPGEEIEEADIHVAAAKLSKSLNKKSSRVWSTSTVSYQIAAMALRMLYRSEGLQVHANSLREIILDYLSVKIPGGMRIGISVEQARETAHKLVHMVSEVVPFLSISTERNPLATATRLKGERFWKGFDAAMAALQVFWETYNDLSTEFTLPKYAPKERGAIEGVVISMVLHMQSKGAYTDSFEKILEGDVSDVRLAAQSIVSLVRVLKKFASLRQEVRSNK